jgi:hypothetical protein
MCPQHSTYITFRGRKSVVHLILEEDSLNTDKMDIKVQSRLLKSLIALSKKLATGNGSGRNVSATIQDGITLDHGPGTSGEEYVKVC